MGRSHLVQFLGDRPAAFTGKGVTVVAAGSRQNGMFPRQYSVEFTPLHTVAAIHTQPLSGTGRLFRCGMMIQSSHRQFRLCPSAFGATSPAQQLLQEEVCCATTVLDGVHMKSDCSMSKVRSSPSIRYPAATWHVQVQQGCCAVSSCVKCVLLGVGGCL